MRAERLLGCAFALLASLTDGARTLRVDPLVVNGDVTFAAQWKAILAG